ncbi:hypothetical protein O6H91_16G029200 [Diphasiastrum complanatum]|uniref:Uncharacterized protein n=3 Tax=Diphasiastrum complanatum TaxID=34168 RepID=A0ACC2BB03_DIPCM|nr:hypothetical protein O6H91_16G029200 [Diphasiastrum complanatum]KAJ7526963.1 hypothetical protein O6H91_16G029200 [Diphasiastrum complanatum]KAJ7526964.1 hypothetical protein O6H91_16G029200 [Diphasiastrum complanatum]
MVHVIQRCRPGFGELQGQGIVLCNWRGLGNRSCCTFAIVPEENVYSNQRTVSTALNRKRPILGTSTISFGVIVKNRVRLTRYGRVLCFESGAKESSLDGVRANEFQEQARSSAANNKSSTESEAVNYYTETRLEVVKSLEEAEAEVLKAILNKDNKSLAKSRGPGYDELPFVVNRASSVLTSSEGKLSEAGDSQSLSSGENSLLQNVLEESPVHIQSARAQNLDTGVAAGVVTSEAAGSLKPPTEEATSVEGGPVVNGQREEEVSLREENVDTSRVAFSDQEPQHDGGKNILEQMREIFVFAGPALGIWLSGPIMSLIDTSVIGISSSLELAALGPGTVLCDQLSYVFMFLSVATSNLIATSLAQKDEAEAARHLSRLLFVSLACGLGMYVLTEAFATRLLQAFVGAKNTSLVPAATTYVKIRALAWPAVLVGLVAQSASFGMQDSWSPLKVLAVASLVNAFGDILLCTFLGYGIAGAAWATMLSQYVAGILMLVSLRRKGYNVLTLAIPSAGDLVHMVELAAPVLLTMLSKVSFYTLITYLATSVGATTSAAHQVMIGICSLCMVWGEPLAQTAQSFMPALLRGANKNLKQARVLLDSLLLMGVLCGLTLGTVAISVPWFLPQLFTRDLEIVTQMRSVTFPFFCSIVITAPTLSLEGTLLAARDLKFLGLSMASCFCSGSILLLAFDKLGFGLLGSWWALTLFQLARFLQSYFRVKSPTSILNEDKSSIDNVSSARWKTS